MAEKKNQLSLWQNLGLILILLIVCGNFADQGGNKHLYQSAFLFIFSFHMPAFFFVAGQFHNNKHIWEKIIAFISLFLLMKALIYLELSIFGKSPSFSLTTEKGAPWVMLAIAAFLFMTFVFKKINRWIILILSIIFGCLCGYLSLIGDRFVLSRILVFYPFYYAGHIFSKDWVTSLRKSKALKVIAFMILFIWAIVCLFMLDKVYYLRPLFTGRNAYSEQFLPYGAVWRLVTYVMSACLTLSLILLAPGKKMFFTDLGDRTLQAYFWHRMVLYVFSFIGLLSFLGTSHFGQIIWLVLGLLVAVLLSLKPFGVITSYITKLIKDEYLGEEEEMTISSDKRDSLLHVYEGVDSKEISVKVEDVSMKFSLSSEKVDSIKEYVIRKFTGKQIKTDEFWALKNISFTIYKGDRLGILGLNGSGKSTLLKTIAGVYHPTLGNIKKNGVIAPLLELGAGFDMQYTARENVYLYGAMLGYDRQFIEQKFDEIIHFAELEKFVDVPLKNYSSGMRARLGFAICTAVEPDILILDEVLSVGDSKFRKKSEKRIMEMLKLNVTVLFVSHSIEQVEKICNKALILEQGELKAFGNIGEVAARYREMTE